MRRDFLYMKVNRKVSEFLGQTRWRPVLADGNFLAYIPDIKARIDRDFLAHPEETAAAIGGVLLTDREAAEEQRGTVSRPLPEATDPRFIMDTPDLTPPAEEGEGSIGDESGTDTDSGVESDGSGEEQTEEGTASSEEQPEEGPAPSDEGEEGGEA